MKLNRFLPFLVSLIAIAMILSGCFLFPKNEVLMKPVLISPLNNATGISTNVTLSWKEKSSIKNLSYRVFFGTSTPPSYQKTISTTQMIENDLKYSTTYYWQVSVFNSSGKVATSNIWHFTTMALPTPSTPILSITNISTNTVSLQWTKSTNAASIILYSATAISNQFRPIVTLPGTRISYSVSELKPATLYKFFIVASNPSGSATSNTVTATTQSIPTPPKPVLPSTPILSVTSISTDSISLGWTKSTNASKIDVYSATSSQFSQITSLSSNATSYKVNGLRSSTTYKFFVVASNPSGSATSNTVTATTSKVVVKPLPPSLSVNSPNTYSAVLAWTESSTNVVGFHVWRRSNSNENYTLITSVNGNVNSYTDIVNPGHDYSYLVSAYNTAGQSFSKSASVFVGQNYFPMKNSNSLATVNAQPAVNTSSLKTLGSNTISLLKAVGRDEISGTSASSSLIPVNEILTYQKSTSSGTTTYTVNVPGAFANQPDVNIALTFVIKNGRVYLQNFAPYPILLLNSVYGNKPYSKATDLFLKPPTIHVSSNSYSRTAVYVPQMTFGSHLYKNVLKVTLTSPSMVLVFYLAPNEGLMSFEILLNNSKIFSYTVTSTFTTILPVYPQAPIVTNPSNNSTVPSTFTLKFTGNSSTYTVYLNSQTLVSTSSTLVNIGPLSDGNYTLVVKAKNSYGLETLSPAIDFHVTGGWVATPTYVIGTFTDWATNSNYEMTYNPVNKIYTLTAEVPASPSVYGVNEYMIAQSYKGKLIKYGYQPIPVTSGSVTFYFDQSMTKSFTSLGIGDTSKENRNWYFTSDTNEWNFNLMQSSGTTFVATVATTGIFEPGTYEYKITPQATFSTNPASLTPYYFNGSYGAYYLPNGSFSIATPSNTIIVKFNVLNSKVDVEATNITSVYLRSSFSSWSANMSNYKFKYDSVTGIYSLITDVPSSTDQQEYKVIYNGVWYGGPYNKNIPVEPGSVTFYFNPKLATDPNSAVGIGDTSKESLTWYFAGDLNSWDFATMTYIGNGTFAATFTGNFSAGDYKFKIAPNNNWTSSPYYYYNGNEWNPPTSDGNGSLHLSVSASKVVVKFNVLKSLVTLQPVISPRYYVAGNFNGWQNVVGNINYEMTPNASGIYTLTTTLPSTTGQYMYKVIDWTGTQIIWYGGNNIPVKSGTVTFYFDPNNNGDNTSALGIGDTTKEKMNWYFTSDLNSWNFATMTYIGNGIFAATLTRPLTNDSAGAYGYKITPQATFSTSPASLTQYYFNGGYGAYSGSGSNGTVIVPQATTIVVDFNVLNSSVSVKSVKIEKLHQVIAAFLDSLDEIHVTLNSPVNTANLSQFSFTVNGNDVPITSIVDANTGQAGISNYVTINLDESLNPSDVASPMMLSISGFAPATVYARYVLNDQAFQYNGQLGAIYTPYQATFKVWSPVSDEVDLLLFRSANDLTPYATYAMVKNSQGVWSTSVMGNLNGVYYEYSYHRYGKWITAPDIYSKGANVDNTKSMVVDLSQTDPGGWNFDTALFPTNMVDAIIYELHVQDFTDNPNSGISSQYQGTYMGFTQTETSYDGIPTGIDHLAKLGIDYVQLLPIEDYEDPQNPGYNWGYVPYLYMVPEAKYSTTPEDPSNTIDEVKQMIESLHSKGIGVILDISFSHTSYVTTPYTAAVPYYYYNYNEYGQRTNYSGVGNDLKTGNYMVKKLIIDTLKYWMTQYHVSGFRFDQMYLYDPQTIQDIVQTLRILEPNVLLYGEPWPANGYKFTYYDQRGMDLGLFNGYFRDAMTGSANSLTAMGFVNGNAWDVDVQNSIKSGIVGSVPYDNLPDTFASEPDETINYATCHDNYTLWDKITGAQPTWNASQDIAAQKLAGAIVMLSQGITFMQGGVEFARTKDGNGNSYNVQSPNEFDWSRLTQFATVDSYYQGLIAIRKAHPAFRMTLAQEIRDNISFLSGLPQGVIGYEVKGSAVGDSWNTIVVYLNGNTCSESVTLPTGDTWNMVVNGATASTNSIGTASGTIQLAPLSAYVFCK